MAPLLEPNVLLLHCIYFIFVSLIGSVILYTKSAQINDLQYVDALFMSFSAMTGTGLSVLDLSTFNAVQQSTLFTLLILGHAIPIHGVIAFLRALTLRSVLKNDSNKNKWQATIHKPILRVQERRTQEGYDTTICVKALSPLKTHITGREISADVPSPDDTQTAPHFFIIANAPCPDQSRQSQWKEKLGPKSFFVGSKSCLSWVVVSLKTVWPRIKNLQSLGGSIDPDEPGWIEYKALMLISVCTILYSIIFLLVGILTIGLWLKLNRPDVPQADGVSPFWAGTFLATSAFVNNGMSLIDANMAPFQREPTPLLICGFLVLVGNTLFPCLLRLVIWSIRKMIPDRPQWRLWRRTFDFVLSQPQTVCTFLYPALHTWFLFGTVLVFNSIMWGAFELASFRNSEIAALPFKYRVLDGIFQSNGVYIKPSFLEQSLNQGVYSGAWWWVLYCDIRQPPARIAHCLSLYDGKNHYLLIQDEEVLTNFRAVSPIISIFSRHEVGKELHARESAKIPCVEAGESAECSSLGGPNHSILARSQVYYRQLRFQLSHDAWWLGFAVLLICVAESDRYSLEPLAFSTFNIIFEVVSAYSFVGVSVGYPGKDYSFCGEWCSFSKVLLIFITLVGRHRELFASTRNGGWSGGKREKVEKDRELQESSAKQIPSANVRS
ncbi:Low-affinity potassium transport protein [Penicillium rolfsii]|nr:Low-affinity potassium transport protein [Penicillium rolfsii]